jgi:hypothetical protein
MEFSNEGFYKILGYTEQLQNMQQAGSPKPEPKLHSWQVLLRSKIPTAKKHSHIHSVPLNAMPKILVKLNHELLVRGPSNLVKYFKEGGIVLI